MSKEIILRFRKTDKKNFLELKNGSKTIETRAASPMYQNIEAGDILRITCGNDVQRKKVMNVRHFRSVDSMLKKISFKKIMPSLSSAAEVKKAYFSYPNYREKLVKYGILVLEL